MERTYNHNAKTIIEACGFPENHDDILENIVLDLLWGKNVPNKKSEAVEIIEKMIETGETDVRSVILRLVLLEHTFISPSDLMMQGFRRTEMAKAHHSDDKESDEHNCAECDVKDCDIRKEPKATVQ